MVNRGKLITFSGLDGAGKTTQIELFTYFLSTRKLPYHVLHMYDDVSVAACLRKCFTLKNPKQPTTVSEVDCKEYRYDKNRKEPYLVFFRKIAYFLDFIVFCLKKFYYQTLRGKIVIMDRYFFDSLANLYGTRSDRFVSFLLAKIPQPDAAFLLDADPQAAFTRKPEYPPEYYMLRREAYFSLFSQIPRAAIIEPNTIAKVHQAVVNYFNRCNSRRLFCDGYSATVEAIQRSLFDAARLRKEDTQEIPWDDFLTVLGKNRMTVRWFSNTKLSFDKIKQKHITKILAAEKERLAHAIELIGKLTKLFEQRGLNFLVMKTLDNYPDLGHDVDIYTDAPISEIDDICCGVLKAKLEAPTLAEKFNNKRNYNVYGYTTLEIHCGKLGELGEDVAIARDLLRYKVKQAFQGVYTYVPRPEYRVILCVLQRMYRHFNIRICDVRNTLQLIQAKEIDWDFLLTKSARYGITAGVVLYLSYLQKMSDFYQYDITIRQNVKLYDWPYFLKDYNNHFRFPLLSTGVNLYSKKILHELRHLNLKSLGLIGLIIPLAVFHFISVKLKRKSKVW